MRLHARKLRRASQILGFVHIYCATWAVVNAFGLTREKDVCEKSYE
jgi:hypothetical protein